MRTLEFTGNRTVPILSCGGDKQSFTVILAVKANREKLPSKVIFKGVRQLRIQIDHSRIRHKHARENMKVRLGWTNIKHGGQHREA